MRLRHARPGLALTLILCAGLSRAQEAPLSAIDWLSESVASQASSSTPPRIEEPPVSSDAATPGITVTPLDMPDGEPIGVLASEETGLPVYLWAASDEATLSDLLRAAPSETLPSLQSLVVDLMLAQAGGARDGDARTLALARVDRLLEMGALEPAEALLEAGDLLDREWFRRWFDVTLLNGSESEACALLRDHPTLAPTLEARVFCLARNGDWNAAALTLGTARALGDVSPDDELLLARFLDPEVMAEGSSLAPERPSPLVYRILEAVGDLMPTTGLPLAFAHADLRSTVAWRTQIEAAERLARRGALSPEGMQVVYMARRPAASGGVWDRAAAVQALDAALENGSPSAEVEAALNTAWAALAEVGLQPALAYLYGPALTSLDLKGPGRDAAIEAGLLSDAYAEAALHLDASRPQEAVWRAVALGEPMPLDGLDARAQAVLAGLQGAPVPDELAPLIEDGRIGEAALRAVVAFGQGLDGDRLAVTDALATLRTLGLEEVARRAALEYLLLGEGA